MCEVQAGNMGYSEQKGTHEDTLVKEYWRRGGGEKDSKHINN